MKCMASLTYAAIKIGTPSIAKTSMSDTVLVWLTCSRTKGLTSSSRYSYSLFFKSLTFLRSAPKYANGSMIKLQHMKTTPKNKLIGKYSIFVNHSFTATSICSSLTTQ